MFVCDVWGWLKDRGARAVTAAAPPGAARSSLSYRTLKENMYSSADISRSIIAVGRRYWKGECRDVCRGEKGLGE